jgi:hypothetical protein
VNQLRRLKRAKRWSVRIWEEIVKAYKNTSIELSEKMIFEGKEVSPFYVKHIKKKMMKNNCPLCEVFINDGDWQSSIFRSNPSKYCGKCPINLIEGYNCYKHLSPFYKWDHATVVGNMATALSSACIILEVTKNWEPSQGDL